MSDTVRYICKFRASDYKLSVDHSGVVHIADHEPEQLEDELSLPAEKIRLKKNSIKIERKVEGLKSGSD